MPETPLLPSGAAEDAAAVGVSVGWKAPAVNPESVFSYETDHVTVSFWSRGPAVVT